jgi:hypothetical protein
MHGSEGKYKEILKKEYHLENLGTNARIILNIPSRNRMGACELDSSGTRQTTPKL